MSEEENAEFFELSAPLRDALETINDYLLRGSKTPTSAEADNEQQSKQIEWAHKARSKHLLGRTSLKIPYLLAVRPA
jgi:hypothetical protein